MAGSPSSAAGAPPRVAVAGAGWAGLASALELAWRGAQVTLFESARQAGGRARSLAFGELAVDNGQHLLVGAYHETLRLIRRLGLDPGQLFHHTPLDLRIAAADESIALRAAPLPAPFHLLAGLWSAQGMSAVEKLALARLTLRLRLPRFGLREEVSVAELLRRDRQGAPLTERFWEPLCLAALNTPAATASARHFLRVLRDTFLGGRTDSDLLFPRAPLGGVLPEPALAALAGAGVQVRLATRVTALVATDDGVTVMTGGGAERFDHLVLATGVAVTRRLLAGVEPLAPVVRQLEGLREDAPIATVYLRYPAPVGFGGPMLGFVDPLLQWVVDRGVTSGQPGVMAVVMSGPGRHMELDRAVLEREVAAALAARFPAWPTPAAALTVRERRATFHCVVEVDRHRPACRTPHPRLWLAGDYTATGYPATLEGAVRSGVECARLILPDPARKPSC